MKKGVLVAILLLLVISLSFVAAISITGNVITGMVVDGAAWNPMNSSLVIYNGTVLTWQIKAAGDLDKDGIADLIWQDPNNGLATVWFMNSEGTYKSWKYVYNSTPTNWQIKAAGDIDRDGIADLIWQLPSNGYVSAWLMNSDGTMKSSVIIYNGTAIPTWQIKTAKDLDNDGITDLIWQNTTGASTVWFMYANGTMKSWSYIYAGTTSWQVKAAGDIDGDGIADLIWQLPSNGYVSAWLMNSLPGLEAPPAVYSLPSGNCVYGVTCPGFGVRSDTYSPGMQFILKWTYYYNNGTSRIAYENVTPTQNSYEFSKIVKDTPVQTIINKIGLSVAKLNSTGALTYNSKQEEINIDYSCSHKCRVYGATNCSSSLYSYRVCRDYNTSDFCLEWGNPISCGAGTYCNSNTNTCMSTGISQCHSYENRVCSYASINNAFATSFSCGISGVTCYECNSSKGYSLNPFTNLSCVRTNCNLTCSAKGGICSNQTSLDNGVRNDSLECCGEDGSSCYICGSGYHAYNENCVVNNCSDGNYPVNSTGVILGVNTTSSGSNIWVYDSSATTSSGCKWKCGLGYRLNSSNNNTCIFGDPDCAGELGGICSGSNVAGAYRINGTCGSGNCYVCNSSAGYGISGSSCVLGVCDSGKTWNGVSCINQGSCTGCIYGTSSCVISGYRLPVAGLGNAYCDGVSHQFKTQKNDSATCSYASECVSNYCNANQCFNLISQIQTSNTLLNKIWCWISSGFRNTSGTC